MGEKVREAQYHNYYIRSTILMGNDYDDLHAAHGRESVKELGFARATSLPEFVIREITNKCDKWSRKWSR
jgi:hypothetical protein